MISEMRPNLSGLSELASRSVSEMSEVPLGMDIRTADRTSAAMIEVMTNE